jgi:glycosyltransferase involved in cell wall biosynthesis
MVIAVATSSPPGVEGGHLVIARAIVEAARATGHDARLVVTPDHGFGQLSKSYWDTWRLDVNHAAGIKVDHVISLRYPSYALRHSSHTCWLNHTMREYYDLWPQWTMLITRKNRIKEQIRKTLLRATDAYLLMFNVSKLYAQSKTIQRRMIDELGIQPEVLLPPPPPQPYRCDGYGDYIFTMSRLAPLKRIDLVVRALAQPPARGVRVVVAGEGDERASLERLASELGVGNRVSFAGRVDGKTMLDHLAKCRAVAFVPFAEDYGLVTVEAFASRKPVITCSDSGGPTELVRNEANGFVCEPTPASVAAALARLSEDSALAERLGSEAAAQAAAMSWPDTIQRLVIV